MKRLLSKTVVVAVAALMLASFGATPASAAAAGEAVLTGTVTPDPVLAAAANPGGSFAVSVSQTGTAAGVVGTSAATCAVRYSSTGTTNVATGSGTGNLDCNGSFVTGGSVSVQCSVSYSQVGNTILVTGSCTGTAAGSLTAECVIAVVGTTIGTECTFAIV